MSKNHSQEVRSLMLKNKALSNEAEDLRHTSQRIHAQLKVGRYVLMMLLLLYNTCMLTYSVDKFDLRIPKGKTNST